MHKKEIQRVEVGLHEKKMIPTHAFLFFYWKRIAEDAFCLFFKIYSIFPFDSYIIICILEFTKKGKIIHMSIIFFFFFFLPLNSTFLHIKFSFPGRQTTKARDFNFFSYQKDNKIFHSLVYSLSIIDKREWVNIHRKCTKILA